MLLQKPAIQTCLFQNEVTVVRYQEESHWYECMLLFEYEVSPTGSCFEQFVLASSTTLKVRKPLGSEAWLPGTRI